MEQLGWLQIGQHQLQQDVTHGLAFVLVDGRDNELDFANLIGVLRNNDRQSPLSRGETQKGGTLSGATLLPCSTLGQLGMLPIKQTRK